MQFENKVYGGFWENWQQLTESFQETLGPEPDYVYAYYDIHGYEGDSIVVYAYDKDGPYYVNTAGHCSCYGLEGSWGPTEHGKEDLIQSIGYSWSQGGMYGTARLWAKEVLGAHEHEKG